MIIVDLGATIILISSLFGIGIIFFSKVPILIELPKIPKIQDDGFFGAFLKKLKSRIKNRAFKSFSFETFLQKSLSRLRILTLKIENKISILLQRLREKSKREKKKENDNYWKKIGESINDKK